MSTFFIVVLGVLSSTHLYLWWRLVRAAAWPEPWQGVLTAVVVGLALLIPVTFYLARRFAGQAPSGVLVAGWAWLGLMFLLLVCVAAGDLLRAAVQVLAPPMDPSRRQSLSRMLALAATGVTGASGMLGARHALGRIAVKKVVVELDRLPAALHGTTIVQLTDVHVGSLIGRSFIESVVETVNSLSPDVIAITGDLVDGSVALLQDAVAPLGSLRARHGTYFVTGNHEFYSGADSWCAHLGEALGIRPLRNERVTIGEGEDCFDLVGIDDVSGPQFGCRCDLEGALEGRDESRELVLLAHQPRALTDAVRLGVGLQISGHTHGGQIWPFNFLVRLQQPVVAGLERFGRTLIYVSRGTGFWGPPMRLGAPAEVTQIVLHSRSRRDAVV